MDEGIRARVKGEDKVTFAVCDFLREDAAALPSMSMDGAATAVWDLVLDKGTFDAIALAEKDEGGHAPADGYPERIGRTVRSGGFFLITCERFSAASRAESKGRSSVQFHRGRAEGEVCD